MEDESDIWEWNTDNQNEDTTEGLEGEAILEKLASDPKLMKSDQDDPEEEDHAAEKAQKIEDENYSEGISSNTPETAATDTEENQVQSDDEELEDAQDVKEDVESNELEGEFEGADDPTQFEDGADILLGDQAGTVVGATDVDGETFIQVKLEGGITGFFHWKDLSIYIPTESDLMQNADIPRLVMGSSASYHGRKVRIVGCLVDDNLYHIQGDGVDCLVRAESLDDR